MRYEWTFNRATHRKAEAFYENSLKKNFIPICSGTKEDSRGITKSNLVLNSSIGEELLLWTEKEYRVLDAETRCQVVFADSKRTRDKAAGQD